MCNCPNKNCNKICVYTIPQSLKFPLKVVEFCIDNCSSYDYDEELINSILAQNIRYRNIKNLTLLLSNFGKTFIKDNKIFICVDSDYTLPTLILEDCTGKKCPVIAACYDNLCPDCTDRHSFFNPEINSCDCIDGFEMINGICYSVCKCCGTDCDTRNICDASPTNSCVCHKKCPEGYVYDYNIHDCVQDCNQCEDICLDLSHQCDVSFTDENGTPHNVTATVEITPNIPGGSWYQLDTVDIGGLFFDQIRMCYNGSLLDNIEITNTIYNPDYSSGDSLYFWKIGDVLNIEIYKDIDSNIGDTLLMFKYVVTTPLGILTKFFFIDRYSETPLLISQICTDWYLGPNFNRYRLIQCEPACLSQDISCFDITSDLNNCGSCGNICNLPFTQCLDGICSCPTGLLYCSVTNECLLPEEINCTNCISCDTDSICYLESCCNNDIEIKTIGFGNRFDSYRGVIVTSNGTLTTNDLSYTGTLSVYDEFNNLLFIQPAILDGNFNPLTNILTEGTYRTYCEVTLNTGQTLIDNSWIMILYDNTTEESNYFNNFESITYDFTTQEFGWNYLPSTSSNFHVLSVTTNLGGFDTNCDGLTYQVVSPTINNNWTTSFPLQPNEIKCFRNYWWIDDGRFPFQESPENRNFKQGFAQIICQ